MSKDTFDQFKDQVMLGLLVGDGDISPKGSIDLPVRQMVNLINIHPNYFTTSSCSGRIVLSYGNSAPISKDGASNKGVSWIYVNHGYVQESDILERLAPNSNLPSQFSTMTQDLLCHGFLSLKVEPFILHISCRSVEDARELHHLALETGFRESGITLGARKTMLAIRTTSFNMELPIAEKGQLLFSLEYLSIVVKEANRRLRDNFLRSDRLLLALKEKLFHYPQLIIQSLPKSPAFERFGHSYVEKSRLLIGGQGKEKDSNKSGRKVGSFSLSHTNYQLVTLHNQIQASVHGCAVTFDIKEHSFLLLSGGRESPSVALPCATLYHKRGSSSDFESFPNVTFEGDVPAPRWGHTLIPINEEDNKKMEEVKFLLLFGRDPTRVFADIFEVTITIDREEPLALKFHWKELLLSVAKGSVALERCFFASCAVTHPGNCEYAHYSPLVIIHGGLTSLSDLSPEPSNDLLVIDVNTKSVHVVPLMYNLEGRFGHTMTVTDGQCILLLGGISSELGAHDVPDRERSGGIVILDYHIGDPLSFSVRRLSNVLPCEQCRVHHQASWDSEGKRLVVLGGGAPSLAFGDHYCVSFVAAVHMRAYIAPDKQNTARINCISSSKKASQSVDFLQGGVQSQSPAAEQQSLHSARPSTCSALLVSSPSLLRPIKVLVEKRGLLDKTKKIFQVDLSSNEIKESTIINRISKATTETSSETDTETEAAREAPATATATVPSLSLSLSLDSGTASVIPVHSKLIDMIESGHVLEGEVSIIDELASVAGKEIVFYSKHFPVSRVPGDRAIEKKQTHEETAISLLQEFIVSAPSSEKEQLIASLPAKYELVGDILMVPEKALASSAWLAVIERVGKDEFWKRLAKCFHLRRVARKAEVGSSVLRESKVVLLYNDIDLNVSNRVSVSNRSSSSHSSHNSHDRSSTSSGHSKCDCGEDHREMRGWVTVRENGIDFSFDTTKVMFCSGNNTERMRMAKVIEKFSCLPREEEETVVDFYAGIGYFTVPLLVYNAGHRVKCLHACEWNPNSLLALHHNLVVNNVRERCILHAGDNRITAERDGLVDIADRVSLGLLPSSVAGWPLAVRALKPSGGVIHVHENVHQRDIDSGWVEKTRVWFEEQFAAAGKQLRVEALHLERVKSYAPRVSHYVLDLKCY